MTRRPAQRKAPVKPIRPARSARKQDVTLPTSAYVALRTVTRCADLLVKLGAWARKRAGILLLVLAVVLVLYGRALQSQIAHPFVAAACGDLVYVKAVAARGCDSVEHCTKHERAYTAQMQVAVAFATEHCEAPPPWTPHDAVIRLVKGFAPDAPVTPPEIQIATTEEEL